MIKKGFLEPERPPVAYGPAQDAAQDVIAFGFTSPGDFKATQIDVAAFVTKNISKAHVFTLVLAEGGKNPGTHLFETKLTHFPSRCCRKVVSIVIPDAEAPVLRSGQRYWIELIASTKTDGGWDWNSKGIQGVSRISYDYGKTWGRSGVGNHPNGAFAVYGTPTGG